MVQHARGSLQICSEPVMQKYRILFPYKDLSLTSLLINQRVYTQSLYLCTNTRISHKSLTLYFFLLIQTDLTENIRGVQCWGFSCRFSGSCGLWDGVFVDWIYFQQMPSVTPRLISGDFQKPGENVRLFVVFFETDFHSSLEMRLLMWERAVAN